MKCKSEFDEEAKMYAWAPLGCGNYAPNFFGTSVPEVVEVRENPDGTVTLTVNAVCDMVICDDALYYLFWGDCSNYFLLGNIG